MNGNVVSALRDIVPLRPLRYSEARRLAELQAQRFLQLVAVHEPPVPERVMTELPRIQVTRLSPFPVSGATHWASGQWLVAIKGSEPSTRQRFSIAHELKHIIDHRFAAIIYAGFVPRDRARLVEQICDYFAGCLLMPRPWVKREWSNGNQHLPSIARTFDVSQAAIETRLHQIGLIDPTPRCGVPRTDWPQLRLGNDPDTELYKRAAQSRFLAIRTR